MLVCPSVLPRLPHFLKSDAYPIHPKCTEPAIEARHRAEVLEGCTEECDTVLGHELPTVWEVRKSKDNRNIKPKLTAGERPTLTENLCVRHQGRHLAYFSHVSSLHPIIYTYFSDEETEAQEG